MSSNPVRRSRNTAPNRRQLPRCPLYYRLRPLTIKDMVPGYEYAPGMSMLLVSTPPVFGEGRNMAFVCEIPLCVPAEKLRETGLGFDVALAWIETNDPEGAAMIENLKRRARHPRSRAYAAKDAAFQSA